MPIRADILQRPARAGGVLVLGLLMVGCAPLAGPAPESAMREAEAPAVAAEPREQRTLGRLDAAYERTKWQWVTNPDGRALLQHTQLPQCYINPDPPLHFHEPGFRMKRQVKAIGNTRYDVILAFQGKDFWEAVYVPSADGEPVLGVYAPGRCQREAERIIEAYELGQQWFVEIR